MIPSLMELRLRMQHQAQAGAMFGTQRRYFKGLGLAGLGDGAQQLDASLVQALSALKTLGAEAERVVDHPPYFSDSAVIATMRKNVRGDVRGWPPTGTQNLIGYERSSIPKLERDLPVASLDPTKRKIWLNNAQGIREELASNIDEAAYQGALNNAGRALQVAVETAPLVVAKGIVKVTETALVPAVSELLKSPAVVGTLVVVGGGLFLWTFRDVIAALVERKVRRSM